MKAWMPWAVAFVVWNAAFDLQVRRAGDAFVADQLARRQRGEPPALLRDAFRPRVRGAVVGASAAAALVLAGGAAVRVRRRP